MSVVIWSKNECPYCDMAKDLLSQREMSFEERKIGNGWSREQLLEQVPDAKTVPQIFIGEQYIGGYTELRSHLA